MQSHSQKTPLMAEQPPPYISQQPQLKPLDPMLVSKMDNVNRFTICQGNVLLEALTGGAWPNSYVIADAERLTPVVGAPEPRMAPTPLFLVQEESHCCARLCCPGRQAFVARIHHATPEVRQGETACGCCYGGDVFLPDYASGDNGVALTLEREGCCAKWPGCFVCSPKCQDEVFVHRGNAAILPGTSHAEASGSYLGRSVQPMGGGGFTPTIDLHGSDPSAAPFATVEGPCCYGGWLGVCTDTNYAVSRAKGKAGDVGTIVKPAPRGCGQTCKAFFTHVDDYAFSNGPVYPQLTPEEKAVLLASFVHLDFLYYENDFPPVSNHGDSNGGVIICTFCQVYMYGCCCPVQICIPYGNKR